jgi:heme exporter protein A
MFAALMQDHLARGGMIVAATHAPLGVPAKELRIGGTS